jgi:two-component system, sensor histidine kinase and response regulator
MAVRILLVEDETDLRENFREILEMNGFEVVDLSNASDALKLLHEDSFDLIISDIMMPLMNGYEFLAQVRANPQFVNIPFLFLTAKVSNDDMRKGMDGGAEDYLIKPIFEASLINAVNASIKKRQARLAWIESTIEETVDKERSVKYHELRTPLFGILSTLEYLTQIQAKELGSPENIGLLKVAHQAAERLNKSLLKLTLFQELASLKRPSSNISSIKQSVSQSNDNLDNALKIVFEGTDFPIEINEQYWTFIVHELLDNCCKFGKTGTEISVVCVDNGISFKNQQDYLAKEYSLNIKPFGQISREMFEHQGLGLGLYICQEYLKYSGAELKAYTDTNGQFIVDIQFNINHEN